MPRPQRRLQTEECQNAGVVRVNKADAPTAIGPEAYASWRATPLGAITEGIEQRLILDLMGDLAGRRVRDAGGGDVPNRRRAQVPGPAGRTFRHGSSRRCVLPADWHACPRSATSRFRARP